MATVTEIESEFTQWRAKYGGTNPQWYVGIASDPRERLFVDHGLSESNDYWKFKDCGSQSTAREVEKRFLGLGYDGGPGGGDSSTKYFYMCFKSPRFRR